MGGAELVMSSPAEPTLANIEKDDKAESIGIGIKTSTLTKSLVIPGSVINKIGRKTQSFDFELGSDIDTIKPSELAYGKYNDSRLGIEIESR